MRNRLMLFGFFVAVTVAVSLTASGGDEPRRGVSIDKIIGIADSAIGYPQGRPDNVEVITAKLFDMKHQVLKHEDVPGDLESLLSELKGKKYWLVQYRKWPIRLDGGLAVYVDAQSGEVISVARNR